MIIKDWVPLIDHGGFSRSREYSVVEAAVSNAVAAVVNPRGNDKFIIAPVRKGNGVVPIKNGFTTYLESQGWELEVRSFTSYSARPGAFDCHYTFRNSNVLPFAVEWETGNISSSHRAINRLALGILQEQISGGLLVLPSSELYMYLTDRVGNARELEPYLPLWREWKELSSIPHYLGIVVVEHDGTDTSIPTIKKGTDGRALI